MALNLTKVEIDTLWEKGFRPYEIYTTNPYSIEYLGEWKKEGEITGWHIEFIFSTRELLKSYPFFDAVIGVDCLSSCTRVWEG